MSDKPIGRLLRGGTPEFVFGCRVNQLEKPQFGDLVRVHLGENYEIFGLIYDIRIDDDGLVRQLVTTHGIDEAIIADNRVNRNVPVEMSALTVGYRNSGPIKHLMPPRPALSLDGIYLCTAKEILDFTSTGRFGYFRHILRLQDAPVGELIASHIAIAREAHNDAGNPEWVKDATKKVITFLKDDYPTLMSVLGALGDAVPEEEWK